MACGDGVACGVTPGSRLKAFEQKSACVLSSLGPEGWLLSLVPVLGLPLVAALFYADGLVVGKFLPPSAVYLAYVALARPTGGTLAVVVAVCVAATTLGQWTLYRTLNTERPELLGVRRRLPWIAGIPAHVRRRLGERRLRALTRNFGRFGGAALTGANVVPVSRSLMTIPAGIGRYPVRRFLLFSTLGNLAYVVALTLVGQWVVDAARAAWSG